MNDYQKYLQARHDYELLVSEFNTRRRQLVNLRQQVAHAHYLMNNALKEYQKDLKNHKTDHNADQNQD